MAQVGSIGERLDLLCRQGANLGPFICTLQNPDLSFVNLTGCTIQGYVRKNALDSGTPVATFSIVYIDRIGGKFSFEINWTVTETIPAGEYQKDPVSQYVWDMELVDSTGRITPLYYGKFENFREVTRVPN